MKWWRVFTLTFSLLFFFAARQLPDGELHLIFCDVGQGDASLIVKGNFQMLIDTGPKNGGVIACLGKHLPFWDRTVEVVVGTHLQADHFGEIGSILEHYRVGEIVLSSEPPVGGTMKAIYDRIKSDGIKIDTAQKGDQIRYGDLYFDVLWPARNAAHSVAGGPGEVLGKTTDPNEKALVLRLSYPGLSALFTSDIGVEQELALLTEGVLGPVDILKVAHHGSKYSSSLPFDEKVSPRWAVVSVGSKNTYGHPAAEILKRFDAVGAQIWRTDRQGEVEFIADEKGYGLAR